MRLLKRDWLLQPLDGVNNDRHEISQMKYDLSNVLYNMVCIY